MVSPCRQNYRFTVHCFTTRIRLTNDDAQKSTITAFVDRIHYPTLGAPALLTPQQSLRVVLSLPQGRIQVDTAYVSSHGTNPEAEARDEHHLDADGQPSYSHTWPEAEQGAGWRALCCASCRFPWCRPARQVRQREAWHLEYSVQDLAPRLYDLQLRKAAAVVETQSNAVRIFREITGKERVIFAATFSSMTESRMSRTLHRTHQCTR